MARRHFAAAPAVASLVLWAVTPMPVVPTAKFHILMTSDEPDPRVARALPCDFWTHPPASFFGPDYHARLIYSEVIRDRAERVVTSPAGVTFRLWFDGEAVHIGIRRDARMLLPHIISASTGFVGFLGSSHIVVAHTNAPRSLTAARPRRPSGPGATARPAAGARPPASGPLGRAHLR